MPFIRPGEQGSPIQRRAELESACSGRVSEKRVQETWGEPAFLARSCTDVS